MDYKAAMRWADALESGQFRQTTDVLHSMDGAMCCLGVLCALETNFATPVESDEYSNAFAYLDANDDQWYTCIPSNIRRAVGMDADDGALRQSNPDDDDDRPKVIIEGEAYNSLADANDKGCTFAQIAAFIRTHWADL